MKKHYKLALILGILAFAIVACNRDDGANAPDLIEPEDGAVFSSEPPTFIWSSQPFADGYTILISDHWTMVDTILSQDDLPDTTYTMSEADFDNLEDSTYYWKAASLKYPPDGSAPDVNWSEIRSFKIEKADTSSPTAPDLIEPAAVLNSESPILGRKLRNR